jgi:hypothetical protein
MQLFRAAQGDLRHSAAERDIAIFLFETIIKPLFGELATNCNVVAKA